MGARPRPRSRAQAGIVAAETAIYLLAATLLAVAAGFTLVGTANDVIDGSRSRPITDTGVFLLDRVLLLFIVAELLYTLRLISFGGRILVEPFLFIGLIAVVRRILVVTAQADLEQARSRVIDFLIEIGALAGLALVLALAIYLLRRGASVPPEGAE